MEPMFSRLHTYITGQLLNLPELELARDIPLLTSGLIDSFHRMNLALFVEAEYGVKIYDTELNGEVFDTLEQLEALINQRRALTKPANISDPHG